MKWTFGIITSGDEAAHVRVRTMIDSIHSLYVDCEIIVVGGRSPNPHVVHIPFDETVKPKWITRKKNIITGTAKYENIAYCHDYVRFMPGWAEGWENHPFEVGMNPIEMLDGRRYRDWIMCHCDTANVARKACGIPDSRQNLIPYSETRLSKLQYISGAYWVAKKSVMLEFPLDEKLGWGEGEDIIWSHRVCRKHDFTINPDSKVGLLTPHDPAFAEMSVEDAKKIGDWASANEVPEGY